MRHTRTIRMSTFLLSVDCFWHAYCFLLSNFRLKNRLKRKRPGHYVPGLCVGVSLTAGGFPGAAFGGPDRPFAAAVSGRGAI